MKLFRSCDHSISPADPANFTGTASLLRMDAVCKDPLINVYRVVFQASARTAWHRHAGPQVLLILEGRCRLQKEGEPVQEIESGGVVRVEPGEKHWHGATNERPMTHLALNINASTTWLAKVSDSEYHGLS